MADPRPTIPAHLSRRSLLRSLFLGAAAVHTSAWLPQRAHANTQAAELQLPSGPLANIGPLEKKTLTAGTLPGIDEELFAPAGFDVRVVARHGLDPLTGQSAADGGYNWHRDPDGGAVFPSKEDGGWVYVSNSEETPGGVGALRFDASGNLIAAYPILQGTRNNCAGGATPWGTWLSCEETGGGEVYECDPFGTPETAVRKGNLGAFPHEAAAIDPRHHACYMTEDGGSNRFWRFVADDDDLTETADGVTRMGLERGRLQVMNIEGFEDGGEPSEADLRLPRKVRWRDVPTLPAPLTDRPRLPTVTRRGTFFAAAEGIWYYEIPESLRTVPEQGSVPTRGVMFFATKRDNRVHAYDIENDLIELIYDNENMQLETGFNDVDNVVVSPAGDVLVAEDGQLMRLVVIVPNGAAKVLMQIRKGGSEITGPAFTPDGSRLYFSSQRGPSGPDGSDNGGTTYEMLIPPAFRQIGGGSPSPAPEPAPTPEPAPVPEPAPAAEGAGSGDGSGSFAAGTAAAGLATAAAAQLARNRRAATDASSGTEDDRD